MILLNLVLSSVKSSSTSCVNRSRKALRAVLNCCAVAILQSAWGNTIRPPFSPTVSPAHPPMTMNCSGRSLLSSRPKMTRMQCALPTTVAMVSAVGYFPGIAVGVLINILRSPGQFDSIGIVYISAAECIILKIKREIFGFFRIEGKCS